MSEHFRLNKDEAHRFCVEVFTEVGISKENAEAIADHLILASLRGVDSHGIIRVPFYLEGLENDLISGDINPQVEKETPISARIDGRRGMGVVVASDATDLAIDKAKEKGAGLVAVKNLGHVGMLAYYTIRIAKEKLVGFSFANGPAWVAPFGGTEKVLGTNPLSYGFPTDENSEPIIFDIATSVSASFKIKDYEQKNKEIPKGWAVDEEGNPITNPARARKEGRLLPFGKHKGYGFGLLSELLASPVAGGIPSVDVVLHASTQGGFFVGALDPTMFRKREDYKKDIQELVGRLKSTKTTEEYDEVMLPGELERKTKSERTKNGIPVAETLWENLNEVAEKLDIEPPKSI